MIRKAFLSLCAIVFLGAPFTAAAQSAFATGNDLLRTCDEGAREGAVGSFGSCISYIIGFKDGFFAGEFYFKPRANLENLQYCIPDGVTNGQIRDIVVLYLRRNPAERHLHPGAAVVDSLRNAFPCRSRTSR